MHLLLALDPERRTRALELRSAQPLTLWLDFHGVTARIDTNSPYLVSHVDTAYGYFRRSLPPPAPPAISLLALASEGEGGGNPLRTLLPSHHEDYAIASLETNTIYVVRGRSVFAYYTVVTLIAQVLGRLRERHACLHGATIMDGDRGLILCGAPRSGKTVLTCLALMNGLGYLSDDVTLLSRQSLEIVPFPRALNIRDNNVEEVRPLLATAERVQDYQVVSQRRLLVRLREPVRAGVRPRVVCLPRFEPGSATKVERLSSAVALAAMLRHRFHPLGFSSDGYDKRDMDTYGRLIAETAQYQVTFAEPADALRTLRRLLDGEEVRAWTSRW